MVDRRRIAFSLSKTSSCCEARQKQRHEIKSRGLADLELVNEDGDGIELVVLLRIHVGRLKL
jgi:hypothetical protein